MVVHFNSTLQCSVAHLLNLFQWMFLCCSALRAWSFNVVWEERRSHYQTTLCDSAWGTHDTCWSPSVIFWSASSQLANACRSLCWIKQANQCFTRMHTTMLGSLQASTCVPKGHTLRSCYESAECILVCVVITQVDCSEVRGILEAQHIQQVIECRAFVPVHLQFREKQGQ